MKVQLLGLVFIASCALAADQVAEKWQKRIDSADAAYSAAVKKADDTRFYAVQKANGDRLTVLKKALTDATKAGDFDAATALKALIVNAEKDGISRPKPKNVVKFGGHEYALIPDGVTWHVAKRMCEEMGGHLAVIESEVEAAGIADMCRAVTLSAWVGASDEDAEGDWRWLNGSKVNLEFHRDNANSEEHCLIFYVPKNRWEDLSGSGRNAYLCEWSH